MVFVDEKYLSSCFKVKDRCYATIISKDIEKKNMTIKFWDETILGITHFVFDDDLVILIVEKDRVSEPLELLKHKIEYQELTLPFLTQPDFDEMITRYKQRDVEAVFGSRKYCHQVLRSYYSYVRNSREEEGGKHPINHQIYPLQIIGSPLIWVTRNDEDWEGVPVIAILRKNGDYHTAEKIINLLSTI